MYYPNINNVKYALSNIKSVCNETIFEKNDYYSDFFNANIFFKREDLQKVRSYKIRGAYNKIYSLSDEQKKNGIVCASAGNHAQGVAFSCFSLKVKGTVYMPVTTPKQKISQVVYFGGDYINLILVGDSFDDTYYAAKSECKKHNKEFIHPFNDKKIIEGQATIGLEILSQSKESPLDYLIIPIGGGGLCAGVSSIFKTLSPKTKIIGVEPQGAPAMQKSIESNQIITLDEIDTFIDGAAVKKVGKLTFNLCKKNVEKIITIPEGHICQLIIELYNKKAIVVEPAGALSIGALFYLKDEIKNANVGCIITGSNNDILRTPEIKERALLYANLKHYFIINFPQRPGALKEFINDVLNPNDDITYFEYQKKHNKENGPAVVGIELKDPTGINGLIKRLKKKQFFGEYLNDKPDILNYIT